jgi:hypothetical protein
MFSISEAEVSRADGYCRQCQKKVNDCEHFVFPIEAKRVSVFDARVETIAYAAQNRVLEIAFQERSDSPGRNAPHDAPPGQIRTSGFTAYGSHLGCLAANRGRG